jgi:hypothetical protein
MVDLHIRSFCSRIVSTRRERLITVGQVCEKVCPLGKFLLRLATGRRVGG